MKRICFAAMEDYLGCITSCRNAASVLGGSWAVIPRDGTTPSALLDADLLILSSWDERYESIIEERRGPIIPRWHSTMLQTELAQESAKIARIVALLDQRRFPALAVNDPEFVKVLGRDRLVFFPDVLDEGEYRSVEPTHLFGVNVSLFGAAHSRKNILVQSAAFDRARRETRALRWTLHLNGQTARDEAYALWLATARIPFVDHGRMQRSGYLSLVAAMNAGLCATLAESYCYVAADHIGLDVPIVASPGLACLGDAIERTRPDDVEAVARALTRAIAEGPALSAVQRRGLDEQSRRNSAAARSALAELVAMTE